MTRKNKPRGVDPGQVLEAYVEAVLREREAYLYDKALKKAGPLTRGMKPSDREAYLAGKAFANLLYRVKKSDRTYQLLARRAPLDEDRQAEFDQLAPMIRAEIAAGREVDLPFLRSVARSRVALHEARQAVALLDKGVDFDRARVTGDAANQVARYLTKADLSRLIDPEKCDGPIVPWLLKTSFKKGVPAHVVDATLAPGSLSDALRRAAFQNHKVLSKCGTVVTPSGETVSAALTAAVRREKDAALTELRRRFPRGRLQHLLRVNPSVKRLQGEADERLTQARTLRSAVLKAVPEHYRDLYPLARQMRRRFILHIGPTNSGKTYEGVMRLHGAKKGVYLGPLRLLAAEQFETLNMDDVPCTLVTGEEQIRVPGSRVQSSTVEMADLSTHYDVAVVDECQMITDRERGGAWTAAIMGLCADEIHACASPDAEQLLTQIIRDCGDELQIVRHRRMAPLEMDKAAFRFPESVKRGDALIVFSKSRVHAVAAELKRRGWHVSLIYGALPPDVRRDQAYRFQCGDSEVVVSTDAIAMGMNLPIQRVVFLEPEKYDGDITRPLTDAEIRQIAGRAGRYGQYDVGYVNAFGFKGTVERALRRPPLTLVEAVISFPDSLLGLPLPLTEIINQWLLMKDKGCFSKASTQRMATLAAMLETPRTDKTLLYRFICIPFDETEPDLLIRWRAMYRAECEGTHVDVLAELPEVNDPEACEVRMLDGLEADYRRCDLYYNYARLFLEDPEAVLDRIQQRKSVISEGIIHILSTQKLQQKMCPECNARLPWNWPYRLCDHCYQRQRTFHRRRRG